MNMQQQILAGVYENNYDFITIIANMIRPTPIGLLYLYGVQGVSKDLAEAKKIADADFLGLIGMIQGTFRVIELKCIEAQEDAGNKGMGGSNVNPDSQGTLEEIIAGMADYEYVIEVLSTPVYLDTLVGWQRRSQEEMSTWYGQLQGQKSLSMNLSIPMMYMANLFLIRSHILSLNLFLRDIQNLKESAMVMVQAIQWDRVMVLVRTKIME